MIKVKRFSENRIPFFVLLLKKYIKVKIYLKRVSIARTRRVTLPQKSVILCNFPSIFLNSNINTFTSFFIIVVTNNSYQKNTNRLVSE